MICGEFTDKYINVLFLFIHIQPPVFPIKKKLSTAKNVSISAVFT